MPFPVPDCIMQLPSKTVSHLVLILFPACGMSGNIDFSRLASLRTAEFPEGLLVICEYAFYKCDQLKAIELRDGLLKIGESAFQRCEGLKSIVLPKGLRAIGLDAFSGCITLEEIVIPDSVVQIEDGAFGNCYSLKGITLPISIKVLSRYLLAGCTALEELKIPSSVEVIAYSGHEDDYAIPGGSLKRIVFEGVVRDISGAPIARMPDLQQIVFLAGPPSLGEYYTNHIHEKLKWENIATIYYLTANKALWAPNDETEWRGAPLVGINSLDDLPPLN